MTANVALFQILINVMYSLAEQYSYYFIISLDQLQPMCCSQAQQTAHLAQLSLKSMEEAHDKAVEETERNAESSKLEAERELLLLEQKWSIKYVGSLVNPAADIISWTVLALHERGSLQYNIPPPPIFTSTWDPSFVAVQ